MTRAAGSSAAGAPASSASRQKATRISGACSESEAGSRRRADERSRARSRLTRQAALASAARILKLLIGRFPNALVRRENKAAFIMDADHAKKSGPVDLNGHKNPARKIVGTVPHIDREGTFMIGYHRFFFRGLRQGGHLGKGERAKLRDAADDQGIGFQLISRVAQRFSAAQRSR
jgi:hypothetical protein